MSSWDIDPPGVSGVVTRVAGHVTDGAGGGGGDGKTLQKQVTDFANHVEDAGTGAASAPIGTALKEFVEHYSPTLKSMGTKTSSCITGAVAATRAYIDGDLEMAAEAQRNATRQ